MWKLTGKFATRVMPKTTTIPITNDALLMRTGCGDSVDDRYSAT